jgi:hypothetical protein
VEGCFHNVTARTIQQFSVSVETRNRVERIGGQIPANTDVRNQRPFHGRLHLSKYFDQGGYHCGAFVGD